MYQLQGGLTQDLNKVSCVLFFKVVLKGLGIDYNLLLERIRQKDERALKVVFNLFYEDLVNFATGYTFDQDQSQDLVQDCFLTLWERAPTLEIKSSLKAYLYGMVRNKCMDYLKSLKIIDTTNFLDLVSGLEDNTYLQTSPDKDTDQVLRMVYKVMDAMPAQMQRIFKMKYLEEYSYNDIAKECNVSINTVKTQLKRAKLKILSSMFLLISVFWSLSRILCF